MKLMMKIGKNYLFERLRKENRRYESNRGKYLFTFYFINEPLHYITYRKSFTTAFQLPTLIKYCTFHFHCHLTTFDFPVSILAFSPVNSQFRKPENSLYFYILWIFLLVFLRYSANYPAGNACGNYSIRYIFINNCTILDGAKVTFGDNVFIAPNVVFSTAGHAIDAGQRAKGLEIALPITVGDNVWIGANVSVLPGVSIGSNTIIGAGSVE